MILKTLFVGNCDNSPKDGVTVSRSPRLGASRGRLYVLLCYSKVLSNLVGKRNVLRFTNALEATIYMSRHKRKSFNQRPAPCQQPVLSNVHKRSFH